MDVFLARQPIFDRNLTVFGYELLYRQSMNNFYEGTDDDQSTASLINNAYFTMKLKDISGGTRAFINFSEKLIVKEIPFLIPKEQIVVEILEHVEPSSSVIAACKKLKKNGYMIALDDFVFQPAYQPLIDLADIIKIEFPVVNINKQVAFIAQHRNHIRFLAEKVETRSEYEQARAIGYDYFQGYFFSKPVMVKGHEKLQFNVTLLRMANEISDESFEYQKVAMLIERDVGLSYKLLKLANSAYYGSQYEIYSIKQALARLGTKEIRKWVYLLLLQDIKKEEMSELINNSMIRAKFLELIAKAIGSKNRHLEFFLLGLFSSIDTILNKPMIEIVEELSLADDVKQALLGGSNELRSVLNQVLLFEKGELTDWENRDQNLQASDITKLYINSLVWASEVIHE